MKGSVLSKSRQGEHGEVQPQRIRRLSEAPLATGPTAVACRRRLRDHAWRNADAGVRSDRHPSGTRFSCQCCFRAARQGLPGHEPQWRTGPTGRHPGAGREQRGGCLGDGLLVVRHRLGHGRHRTRWHLVPIDVGRRPVPGRVHELPGALHVGQRRGRNERPIPCVDEFAHQLLVVGEGQRDGPDRARRESAGRDRRPRLARRERERRAGSGRGRHSGCRHPAHRQRRRRGDEDDRRQRDLLVRRLVPATPLLLGHRSSPGVPVRARDHEALRP